MKFQKKPDELKAPWERSKRGLIGGLHYLIRRPFELFGVSFYKAYTIASLIVIPLFPFVIPMALIAKARKLLIRSLPLAYAKEMVAKRRSDRVYYFAGLKDFLKERKIKDAKKAADAIITKSVKMAQAGVKAQFSSKTVEDLLSKESVSKLDVIIGYGKSIFGLLFGRPLGGTLSTERFIVLRNLAYAVVVSIISVLFISLAILSFLAPFGSPLSYFSLSKMLTFSLSNNAIGFLFYAVFSCMLAAILLRITELRLSSCESPRHMAFKARLLTDEEYESKAVHVMFVRNPLDSDEDIFYFRMPNLVYGYGSDPSARISKLGSHVNMLHSRTSTFRVSRSKTIHGSSTSELVFLNTPAVRPPIFASGAFSTEDNFELWRYFAANAMKRTYEATGKEHLFWGEIVDPSFDGDNHLLINVDECPHFGIVGRTGSGKTKTAQSLAFAIKYAFPESILLFADGKSSLDWDAIASKSSPLPVAKARITAESNDPVIQLANVLTYLKKAYEERVAIFERAGRDVKNITDYRALGHKMPRIFCFLEEFGAFRGYLNWDASYDEEGSLANIIKRIVAEARYCGIHLVFISQRYQGDDIPTKVRSNLTMLIHALEKQDADSFLKIPEVKLLTRGFALTTAPGIFNSDGDSHIKIAVPYLGENVGLLADEHLVSIDPAQKKNFNFKLIYKTSGGQDKLSKNSFVVRVASYLEIQNWKTIKLVADAGAAKVQLEAIKSYKERIIDANGVSDYQLTPYEDACPVGISVLEKSRILNPDTLFDIQDAHPKYKVVIVFLMDAVTRSERVEIQKLVADANERGSKFIIIERETFDENSKKLIAEGGGDTLKLRVQTLLGLKLSSGDELPTSMKIEHIIARSGLKIKSTALVKQTPVFKFAGPAGRTFCFVVGGNARDLDTAAREVAIDMSDDQGSVVFFVAFAKTDDKKLAKSGVVTVSRERIAELYNEQDRSMIISTIIRLSGIVKHTDGLSYIPALPRSSIDISTKFSQLSNGLITSESKARFYIQCHETGIPLFFKDEIVVKTESKHSVAVSVDEYRADAIGLPDEVSVYLKNGVAPLGVIAHRVKDSRKEKPAFDKKTGYTEKDGVLVKETPSELFGKLN